MISNNYLIHYGVKGQKWGERNYQNSDGSLTPLGREHYGVGSEREERSLVNYRKLSTNVSNAKWDSKINRANKKAEKAYSKVVKKATQKNVDKYNQLQSKYLYAKEMKDAEPEAIKGMTMQEMRDEKKMAFKDALVGTFLVGVFGGAAGTIYFNNKVTDIRVSQEVRDQIQKSVDPETLISQINPSDDVPLTEGARKKYDA